MNKNTILILVLAVLGVAIYFGMGEVRKHTLEESVVPVVDQVINNPLVNLMAESLEIEVAKCNSVSIVEKIGQNTYTGVAILDNGNVLNIKIQDLGENIVVEIIE